ncbi:hypothetical protein T11_17591 [Trichinella zimbabwensis]|uniref:Uncharacterized protein n=1 Tax=Trichinella zimbabwensis TaxID=268475 RepID=A0A0V1GYR9_9BILA|nr:hypothetical protein T11_17591 [Trichinella zimbabwensis]
MVTSMNEIGNSVEYNEQRDCTEDWQDQRVLNGNSTSLIRFCSIVEHLPISRSTDELTLIQCIQHGERKSQSFHALSRTFAQKLFLRPEDA